MIKRYEGNTGRMRPYKEPEAAPPRSPQPRPAPGPRPAGPFEGLDKLGRLLPQKLEELETEDLLLMLILYLLYRESGDKELLLIMGGMFLL